MSVDSASRFCLTSFNGFTPVNDSNYISPSLVDGRNFQSAPGKLSLGAEAFLLTMIYTKEQCAAMYSERAKWDWTLSDCELSRIHGVVRPCVQKTRMKLGFPSLRQLAPSMPAYKIVPTPDKTLMEQLLAASPVSIGDACGIYGWVNILDGKWYIGQSLDIAGRQKEHLRALIYREHFNEHLQSAFTLHGQDNFKFAVLEECDHDLLDHRETAWIARLRTLDRRFGYNVEPGGKNSPRSKEGIDKSARLRRGKKWTQEQRAAIKKSRTGRPLTDKQRAQLARMHAANKGRQVSDETRRRLSESLRGRAVPTAALEGLRKWREENKGRPGPNLGKKASAETRLKQSISAKNRPPSRLGHKASSATRLKLSFSHMGKTRAPARPVPFPAPRLVKSLNVTVAQQQEFTL